MTPINILPRTGNATQKNMAIFYISFSSYGGMVSLNYAFEF